MSIQGQLLFFTILGFIMALVGQIVVRSSQGKDWLAMFMLIAGIIMMALGLTAMFVITIQIHYS